MTNIVIASAARTAVGSFGGAFASTPAHVLGTSVLEAIVERAGIEKGEVSETILGQVLTAAQAKTLRAKPTLTQAFPKKHQPGQSTRFVVQAFAR